MTDEQILAMHTGGKTYEQIATKTGLTFHQVKHAINRARAEQQPEPEPEDINAAVLQEIQKQVTVADLVKKYKLSGRVLDAIIEDLKADGYLINREGDKLSIQKVVYQEPETHVCQWTGDQIIRFGVVADTHLCSKWQQLTHLNTVYDIFQREGITTVYHAGDITEGYNMRTGHEYEVFKHGADEQVEYVIENYPSRSGLTTYFITGNHDHSHIKAAGHDIGKPIARAREDMCYLGMANAKVKLTPNCTLEINHPLDGSSYALSYSLQKTIDAMSGGEKPNILLNGHHHKTFQMFYRNIHAFECGTLQSQTNWMRGKRLPAHIGGWILTVHVDGDGTVTRCIGEWIPFYDAIAEDY